VSGKLQHATGPAQGKTAQVALRQAARAIDRARGTRLRDPRAAVELWRCLVEGRWSLVDRFDSDGRHFLIARRNPPPTLVIRELSGAQQQVAALAAQGRSNKLIAYELGLSVGTVATHLMRALRKLGIRSRVQLISEWPRLASTAKPESGEEG
jgi:DNA-binding CsgD family transcriptional regulator